MAAEFDKIVNKNEFSLSVAAAAAADTKLHWRHFVDGDWGRIWKRQVHSDEQTLKIQSSENKTIERKKTRISFLRFQFVLVAHIQWAWAQGTCTAHL